MWLTNFKAVAIANDEVLELNADEVLALNSGTTGYSTSLTALEAAKKAQNSATTEKNASKAEITALVRSLSRKFKGNANVSETLLRALGILSTSTAGPVVTVTGLDVKGCDDGVNQIKFDRTGNAPGTTFIIEYKVSGSAFWLFGDAITKTTWDHNGQTPGVQVWYRVTSARAGQRSVPSVEVSAYPNSESSPLTIAA